MVVDGSDPELPGGTQVPSSSNPLVFVVQNNDPENLNFALTDSNFDDGSDVNATGGPDGNVDTDDGDEAGDTDDGGETGDTDDGDGAGDTDGDTGGDSEGESTDGNTGSDNDDTDGSNDSNNGDPDGSSDSDSADSDENDGSNDGSNDGADSDGEDNSDGELAPNGGTDAMPDEASVNQGETVVIDVLANDIDGAGVGLTLSAVSTSPNAIVTIENGMISYTPNFGFFGSDTFTYTVTDGNGVESSATVTVAVNRFSDINNNGLNDFDECDCSSLQLETGIHGSGLGGGVVHWSLLLFLGMVGLVRRSLQLARQPMSRRV